MGSLFGGKTKSTTESNQTYGPPTWVQNAYKGVVNDAQKVADTRYNPATNSQVAGFTAPQWQGFGAVNQNQGAYQPYMDQAAGLATLGSSAITGDQIAGYMNPYTQQVIDASMNDWQRMSQRRMTDTNSNAAKVGALTGDRSQVAQALAREAADNEMSSGIANLRNQGWQSALGAAQTDASRALQGAQVQGALGGLAQDYGYKDANALLDVGKMQQDLSQKRLDTNTANAKQRSAYDFETTQWLASLLQGIGSQAGGTQTGTGTTTQKGGSGILGPLLGAATTLFGMSDERVKEDVEPVGQTFDGQPIYRYRFAGSPKTEIGLLAQEVEQRHPEAVADIGGLKHVNYQAATEDAARPRYADGGGVGNLSYVPRNGMGPGQAMQPAQMSAPAVAPSSGGGGMSGLLDSFSQAKSALGGGESGSSGGGMFGDMFRTTTDPSSGWSTTVNPSSTGGWMNYLGNAASSAGSGGLSSLMSMFGGGFSHGGAVEGYADGGDVDRPFIWSAPLAEEAAPQPARGGLATLAPTPAPAPVSSPAAKAEAYKHILWNNGLGEDASNALIMAGLGMLGGGGRNAFEDIGRGGLAGMQFYQGAQKQRRADAEAKAKEAQGKVMEIGGRLIRLLPDGTTSVVYDGGAADQGKLMEVNGKVIRAMPNGSVSVVYDSGPKAGEQTAEDRARLAVQYGIDPNSDAGRSFILTGKLPREDQQMLTATDKKAILEADDKVAKNIEGITQLEESQKNNKDAYQGFGTSVRTWAGNSLWDSLIPDWLASPDRAAATTKLDNALTAGALAQLKEIFGGAPTEGERKILIEMQGASDKPTAVREDIIRRASIAAKKRLDMNKREAEQLRGGTYFKPGGGMTGTDGPQQPSPAGVGGAPIRAKNAEGQVIEFNGKEWVPVQ